MKARIIQHIALVLGFAILQPSPLARAQSTNPLPEAAVNDANAEIGRVYKRLMATLSPEAQTKLRDDQRAWIKWRDQEAARLATAGGAVGGSAYREDYESAQLKLIRERTEVLRRRLK